MDNWLHVIRKIIIISIIGNINQYILIVFIYKPQNHTYSNKKTSSVLMEDLNVVGKVPKHIYG